MYSNHRPLRIAHFVQRYPPALGGSESYFARLSRHLINCGDKVTVFCTNAIDLEAFWSANGSCTKPGIDHVDGIEVRRYGLWRMIGRRYLLKALSFWPNRRWQCLTMPCNPISFDMWRDSGSKSPAFDIVHATAFPYAWPIACALRLARRQNVPFVVTPFLHLGDPDNPRDRTRRAYTSPALLSLLREADAVFVQTASERQELCRHRLDPGKIHLQGLGVDFDECTGGNRSDARKNWQIAPDDLVIGHLANHSFEKGTIDLLLAAERLWQTGIPLRVALAGCDMPNFRRFWNDFCQRLPSQWTSRVLRLGRINDDAKADFFAAIDLFALPSRSDSFGLVLLEAWANGLPNVAYRAGGPADLIDHDQNGLLVPCGDITGLAVALGRLANDASLRQRLGEAGKHRTTSDFQWTEKLNLVRDVCYRLATISSLQQPPHPELRRAV